MNELMAFLKLNKTVKDTMGAYENIETIAEIPHVPEEAEEHLKVVNTPESSLLMIQKSLSQLKHPEDIGHFPISCISLRTILQHAAHKENLADDKDLCRAFCLLTKVSKMKNREDIKTAIDELKILTFTKKQLLAHEYALGNLNYVA